MEIIDYNGDGRWSRDGILERYARYVDEFGGVWRDLAAREHAEGGRRWVYSVMEKVTERIEAGDRACIELGVEFIEEDGKFPFGKLLKSETARALRRAAARGELSDEQRGRVRRRVLGMLRAGQVPHEFREYAKLVRQVGFAVEEIGEVPGTSERVRRFRTYLEGAARP